MKWVIIKGVRYPSSVISAFAAYNMDNPFLKVRIRNKYHIIDYLDESFMHANCGDCKEEVVITDVDRVKKDIDSMFFKFVKKNGKEPEYVECQIVWKDTGDDQRTTIKLSLSINDDDNDNVFYYCNGIESLKSLVEYGVGEFIVIDCWSFF